MEEQRSSFSEEIDIRALFLRVFARWRVFFLYTLGSALAIAAAAAYYAANTNKVATRDIRLFGVETQYPNGTPFDLTDFLEPMVLQELFTSTGLTQFDPEEYENIVSVSRAVNDVGFIMAKYAIKADMIASSKDDDSLSQLQQLGFQRDEELNSANKGIITLQVDYEKHGLSKDSAEVLLNAWPRIWEEYFTREYRVIADLSLNSMALIAGGDLSIPENAYYARQQLDFVRANITKFSGDLRFRRMESNRGRTPIEILRGIDEYDRVLFTPLYSSILSIDSPLSEFYLSDQELRIEQLDKQIASLQTVVDDITKMEVGVRNEPGNGSSQTDGDIIQIGDGTLNDIVGLVQKASLQDFLTSTLERRHGLVVEKTEVEKSLAQVQGNTLLSPEFVETVSKIHQDIMDEYGDLLLKAEVIAFSTKRNLFESTSDVQFIGSRFHPKLAIWPGFPAAGLFLLAMICVVIPTRKEIEQRDDQQWP